MATVAPKVKEELKRTLHRVFRPLEPRVEIKLLKDSEPITKDIIDTVVDIVRNAEKGTDIKDLTEEVHTIAEEKVRSGKWNLHSAIVAVGDLLQSSKSLKGLDNDQQAKVRILIGDVIGSSMAEVVESLDRLEGAAGIESRSIVNRVKSAFSRKWIERAL
ncbi:MAG: hypothetical protein QF775_02750 [archaeon]|jgi:polyhydroxyalkanoate synthesis regulator phasin|nr:hypothetical protein [Euryarchaeota archaeon]MDP6704380.1 hypothetical protein [archaeon]HIK01467.1 hypothetical protein [Candidatus Undinarchaeales archaeon ERR594346 U_76725]|tara:strand:- start:13473 stop:13952 length:480 start_codon:yes stop_codon:yes gene_type:complete